MKLAKAIVLAAIPSLLITACGGGNNATPSVTTPQSVVGGVPVPSGGVNAQSAVRGPIGYDTSANDLHGGGATFPALGYNGASQPVGLFTDNQALPTTNSLFNKTQYGGTANVYYCLTGSGFGKGVFTGANTAGSTAACAALGATPTGFGGRQDPPDFAGTDQGMLTTEYSTYLADREGGVHGNGQGEPFEMPSIAGPIVFPYNPANLSGLGTASLKLSRWTYCAIANGTVSTWNDPAIVKDNGGKTPATGAITFVYRSDGSGTSFLFQNHLNTVCGTTWPAPYNAAPYESAGHSANWGRGTSKNWLGPTGGNFVGASGNPGVIATIQADTDATGYAEGAYVAQTSSPTLKQAMLRNNAGLYRAPTSSTATAAAVAGMSLILGAATDNPVAGGLGSSRSDCILFVDPNSFANPTGSAAYPIVGSSYLLFYSHNNISTHLANIKKLAKSVVSSHATTLLHGLEYQPLPAAIRSTVTSAISGTNAYAGKPCIVN